MGWLPFRFRIGIHVRSGQKIKLLNFRVHVHCYSTTKLDGCTCTSAIFAELCLPCVHVSICRLLLLYVVLLSPSLGNGLYKPTMQLN